MDLFYVLLFFSAVPSLAWCRDLSGSFAFEWPLEQEEDEIVDPSRVIQLSWGPRIFLYKGFLSDEECDHLIWLADGKLKRTMVEDDNGEAAYDDEERTNYGYFLQKDHDSIVSRIENRIQTWTFLPKENGEAIEVLRYQLGQKYNAHYDVGINETSLPSEGRRLATVLLYLSNVAEGGETVFPFSQDRFSQLKDESWSECARKGYAVKPMKGDAVLFFSLLPNSTTDERSLHGGCPVIQGEKWLATKWIRAGNFDKYVEEKRRLYLENLEHLSHFR